MQNLYYAQQTAKTEVTTVKALSGKVRRLEQALDETQERGRPSYVVNLRVENARLEQALNEAQLGQVTGVKPFEDNLVAGLRADAAQLAKEKGLLAQEKHQMRNCSNCYEAYCDGVKDAKAVKDCKDNDHFHWSLDDVQLP